MPQHILMSGEWETVVVAAAGASGNISSWVSTVKSYKKKKEDAPSQHCFVLFQLQKYADLNAGNRLANLSVTHAKVFTIWTCFAFSEENGQENKQTKNDQYLEK